MRYCAIHGHYSQLVVRWYIWHQEVPRAGGTVRNEAGQRNSYRVRLHDLLKKGDIGANRPVKPGDILIIPESWF